MKIFTVSNDKAPLDLLALADPSPEQVSRYLQDGTVFVGEEDGSTVAVAVIRKKGEEIELLNIAVSQNKQGNGLGKQMLFYVLDFAQKIGIANVTVGTGNSSLDQLAFYQKHGFRITGVVPGFFKDYSPPIFENGIRCLDMVLLSHSLRELNKP